MCIAVLFAGIDIWKKELVDGSVAVAVVRMATSYLRLRMRHPSNALSLHACV
eukprot:COSAG02_NODE_45654_length_355_cov_0.800781_1_plen_51_part_01